PTGPRRGSGAPTGGPSRWLPESSDAVRVDGVGSGSEQVDPGQASVAVVSADGAYWARPNCASSASIGRAPATPSGCWPGRKKAIVGMLMMLKACDMRGLASTSILTKLTLPSFLAALLSISGAIILKG